MNTLHATCVAVAGHGVLLRGPSGSGKSDLALRLIDEGATLIGDDYCAFTVRDGVLVAAAPPTTAGLIEVRGMGILRVGHAAEAVVRVVVDLTSGEAVERLPPPRHVTLFGIRLPAFALAPFEAAAAAKVRLAVRLATGDISAAT